MKTALVFRTHIWNDFVKNNFEKIQNEVKNIDVYLSVDNINIKANHYFGASDIKYSHLNHSTAVYNGHQMMSNPELAIIDFAQKYDYDNYYLYEYDIVTKGNYGDIFDILQEYDHDYIASALRTSKGDFFKCHEINHWLKQLRNIPYTTICMGYHPLVRYSKKALKILDNHFQNGCWGYCEIIVPTIFHNNDLRCFDLLNTGVTNLEKMCLNTSFPSVPEDRFLYHAVKS